MDSRAWSMELFSAALHDANLTLKVQRIILFPGQYI